MQDDSGLIAFINKKDVVIIGEKYLTPIRGVIKNNSSVEFGENVYFGQGTRDKVFTLRGRVPKSELINLDIDDLNKIFKLILKGNEQTYVGMINKAGFMSIGRHQIELLPGIGDKYLKKILDQREERPFSSYKDFKDRTDLDLEEMITERIRHEMLQGDNIHMFVLKE